MSKLADQLREVGIYNIHGIASDGQPMLTLYTPGPRDVRGRSWHVGAKDRILSKNRWDSGGCLTFSYYSLESRATAKQDALAWIHEHFPEAKMVPGPFGSFSYVTKADLDAAKAKLKEL